MLGQEDGFERSGCRRQRGILLYDSTHVDKSILQRAFLVLASCILLQVLEIYWGRNDLPSKTNITIWMERALLDIFSLFFSRCVLSDVVMQRLYFKLSLPRVV